MRMRTAKLRLVCLSILGALSTVLIGWASVHLPTAAAEPNAVIVVNDTADNAIAGDGHCTLREAINAANAYGSAATINFSVSGNFLPATAFPSLNHAAALSTLDGTGQTVNGNASFAIGDPNTVNGNGSFVLGNNNTVNGANVAGNGDNIQLRTSTDLLTWTAQPDPLPTSPVPAS